MNEPRINDVDPSAIGGPAMLGHAGYFVALSVDRQRWLRTLNIDHHQILTGTGDSMPGTAQPLTEAAE